MNDAAKAESERIWNELRYEIEALSGKMTALYEVVGSTRTCRHINELWRPENPAVGIGFVPPEAREVVDALFIRHDIDIHRSNGPLGKNVYYSLLYNPKLTTDRLNKLSASVDQEIRRLRDVPRATPKPTLAAELIIEEQVARMEGLQVTRAKLKSRPAEVATIVDSFNQAVAGLEPMQAVKKLSDAIPYLELPEDVLRELLRVLDVVRSTSN